MKSPFASRCTCSAAAQQKPLNVMWDERESGATSVQFTWTRTTCSFSSFHYKLLDAHRVVIETGRLNSKQNSIRFNSLQPNSRYVFVLTGVWSTGREKSTSTSATTTPASSLGPIVSHTVAESPTSATLKDVTVVYSDYHCVKDVVALHTTVLVEDHSGYEWSGVTTQTSSDPVTWEVTNVPYNSRIEITIQGIPDESPAGCKYLPNPSVPLTRTLMVTISTGVVASTEASEVAYTPAGANAVVTTVQSSLRERVCVFDFMTAAQVADVKANTALIDVTAAIQAAIVYASSRSAFQTFLSPMAIIGVEFPCGRYLVTQTLLMVTNGSFCNLLGQDGAELVYTGSGACLHIGNNSTNGIMPVHVKNLNFYSANTDLGTIGLWVQAASNGYYEGLTIQGFEQGILNEGSINCLYDFKRRSIHGSKYGFVAKSLSPSPAGLRYANNLLTVRNCHFGGGVQDAFTFVPNATPPPCGGLATMDYCTFETVVGNSISIQQNGEVQGLDRFVISNCWFEKYGISVASLTSAKVMFKNCFIAGATAECIVLNDDKCNVICEQLHAYFPPGSAPTSGSLVTSTIGSTDLAGCCSFSDCDWLGSVKSTPWQGDISKTDPPTVSKRIILDSQYPTANNDYNYNLELNLFTVFTTLCGPLVENGRVYVDFFIFASDGLSVGSAQYRLYYQDVVGTAKTSLNTLVPGAGITVSGTTITFPATGGTWYKASMHVLATYLT